MNLYDYMLLGPEEQADITWQHGAFIAVADRGFTKVLLYQLSSFYVEVYYNCELGKIEEFRSFDSTDQLAPYLAAIDVSGLIPAGAHLPPATGLRKRIRKTLQKFFCLLSLSC